MSVAQALTLTVISVSDSDFSQHMLHLSLWFKITYFILKILWMILVWFLHVCCSVAGSVCVYTCLLWRSWHILSHFQSVLSPRTLCSGLNNAAVCFEFFSFKLYVSKSELSLIVVNLWFCWFRLCEYYTEAECCWKSWASGSASWGVYHCLFFSLLLWT